MLSAVTPYSSALLTTGVPACWYKKSSMFLFGAAALTFRTQTRNIELEPLGGTFTTSASKGKM